MERRGIADLHALPSWDLEQCPRCPRCEHLSAVSTGHMELAGRGSECECLPKLPGRSLGQCGRLGKQYSMHCVFPRHMVGDCRQHLRRRVLGVPRGNVEWFTRCFVRGQLQCLPPGHLELQSRSIFTEQLHPVPYGHLERSIEGGECRHLH